MKPDKPHNSMRGHFGWYLYDQMEKNEDIWVLVGDLGYGMFDAIKNDFPERFINCGAAEQVMMDIAVGLAYEGRIPVVYSITPFLLYRPFETIRTYINHEKLPVKMIGSGRDDDYKHDGFSHDASDAMYFLELLNNVVEYWPSDKVEMQWLVKEMLGNGKPTFVSLRR